MAAFVGYAGYLLFYLPSLEWSGAHVADMLFLLIPLLTAPLGAVVGNHFLRRPEITQMLVII